jgi:uncharacterized membrane protein
VTRRLPSIDILRGLVMVLMAIDHVRVYAGVPPGGPDPAVFFTRWITHFCAPVFVFLAGSSAFLQRDRLGAGALARRLVVRGLWIVLLELTLVRVAWTFNLAFDRYVLAGVLWMIGCCMILMAPLVRLPVSWVAGFGLVVVAGHNLSALLSPETTQALVEGRAGGLWKVLYFGGALDVLGRGQPQFFVLYSLVPWIGVMALGYAFGPLLRGDDRVRDCLAFGGTAIALFLALRASSLYGDRPWSAAASLPLPLAFLNTTKYPASLQFLLMTLGPALVLLAGLDAARGPVARVLTVFGRVPFAYYLLHIPLIHGLAVLISLVRTPAATAWLFQDHPLRPGPVPEGYMWSLPLLYAVTAFAVTVLYFPCRWFAEQKRTRKDAWLSYL